MLFCFSLLLISFFLGYVLGVQNKGASHVS